jgi:hypothetical protein
MTAPVRLLALPRGVRPDSFAAEDVRKALRALARYAAYQDPQRKLAKGTVQHIIRRAAIYARVSTDRQNKRSIDDRIALCRTHTARQGWPT